MQKKEKLQKLANDIKKWFKETPNFIAYNAIGAAVHVNNGQLPEIKFQKTRKPKMVIDVNGLENVKKWQDVPKEIVITYNPDRLKQVGIADPEQYLQESFERAFEQEYPVFSQNHRVSLATKPQNNDLLSFYVQTGEKSKQPIYFKHTFNTVEQLNTYLQSRKINNTMLKQQYLSSQKGPISNGIPLPRPLNAPPFQNKVAMNNPGDLLQQILIDKKYDTKTIQGVIQSVGKNNFFSDKNQSLDGINVEYNWSTDDKKQYKSLKTFSDINYDEHQGCFPIIREMLQVVLTKEQFKKVKYSQIKKQIILPKDAFEKDNNDPNYNPIQGFHNVDILYKDYIYKVLEDISNQHNLFSKKLSQQELIFFAINRIKADYQAARFYFKEPCNIDDELIDYSQRKGHYIDDDSSTGMKFQNHTYINLKPLFNQGGKPIKSVHVKNGNDWRKVDLNSDYDLSQEQLDKLTDLTEVYVKGGEPLNKHTYKDDCEITNHHLDIYRNAAMLAALDGRYFPSQDENQDKYYLTHAHWFTLFKINKKKLLDYVEKEPYAAQHSFNNNNYNPYQIEQITINNNEQQTCRKITTNKTTTIADDDEIIKRLLNLGFAGIPLNKYVEFDEYGCSKELRKFYTQMANNPLLLWNTADNQNSLLKPQLIMLLLIRTAFLEGFNLNETIRHFAKNFDTYKEGSELPADDVIGNKICDTIDNVVRAGIQAINQQQVVGQNANNNRVEGDNATDGGQNDNNNGTQVVPTPPPAGVAPETVAGPQPVTTVPPAVSPPVKEIVCLAGEDESQDIFVKIDSNGNVQANTSKPIGTPYKTVLPPNYLYRFFEKLSELNQPGREPTKCKEDLLHMIDCIFHSKDVGVTDKISNAKVQLLAKKILGNINNPIPNNLTYRALFTALKTFLDDQQSPADKTFEITTELSNIGGDYVTPNGRLRLRSDEDNPQEIVSSFAYPFSSGAKIKLVYHDQSKNKCLVQIDETYFITETTTTTDLSTNRPLTFIKLLVDDGQILEAREIDITNVRPFQEVAQLNIEGGKIKVQEINPVQTIITPPDSQIIPLDSFDNATNNLGTNLNNNIQNKQTFLLAGEDESQNIFVKIDSNGNVQATNRQPIGTPYKAILPPNYLFRFFVQLSQINAGDPQQNAQNAKKLITMIDNILNSKMDLDLAPINNNKLLMGNILNKIGYGTDTDKLTYQVFFEDLQKFLKGANPNLANIDCNYIAQNLTSFDGFMIKPDENLWLQLYKENQQQFIVSSFNHEFQSGAKIKLVYHDQTNNRCLVKIGNTYFITKTTTIINVAANKSSTFIQLSGNNTLTNTLIDITNARPPQEVAQLNIEGGKIKINPAPAQVKNIIDNADDLNLTNNSNTVNNPFGNNTNSTGIQNNYVLLVNEENVMNNRYIKINDDSVTEASDAGGAECKTVLPPNYLYLFFQKLSKIDNNNKEEILGMIDNILNSNLPLDITIGGNAKQLIASILQIIQENIDVSSLKYREFFEKLQEFLRKQELDLTKINFSNIEEKLKSVDNYLISKYENLFLVLNTEDPLKINSSFCWIFRQNSIIKLLHVTPEGKCLISINGTYFNVNAVKEDTQTVIKFLVDDNQVLETQEIDITNARPPQEVAQLDIVGGKIKVQEINPVQTIITPPNSQISQLNNNTNNNTNSFGNNNIGTGGNSTNNQSNNNGNNPFGGSNTFGNATGAQGNQNNITLKCVNSNQIKLVNNYLVCMDNKNIVFDPIPIDKNKTVGELKDLILNAKFNNQNTTLQASSIQNNSFVVCTVDAQGEPRSILDDRTTILNAFGNNDSANYVIVPKKIKFKIPVDDESRQFDYPVIVTDDNGKDVFNNKQSVEDFINKELYKEHKYIANKLNTPWAPQKGLDFVRSFDNFFKTHNLSGNITTQKINQENSQFKGNFLTNITTGTNTGLNNTSGPFGNNTVNNFDANATGMQSNDPPQQSANDTVVVDLTGLRLISDVPNGFILYDDANNDRAKMNKVLIYVSPESKLVQIHSTFTVNNLAIGKERITWGNGQNVQKVLLKMHGKIFGEVKIQDRKGEIKGDVLKKWLSLCKNQQQINNTGEIKGSLNEVNAVNTQRNQPNE